MSNYTIWLMSKRNVIEIKQLGIPLLHTHAIKIVGIVV